MKTTLMAIAAMTALVGLAGQDDLLVTLSAKEQLVYANTREKVNNELVALVWTPKGSLFQGFYADGSTVNADSKVLARILVKDGRFETTTFQISAKFADQLKLSDGTFALYLLDTRGGDGKAIGTMSEAGVRDGVVPVNYYARIAEGQVSGAAVGTVETIASEGSADGTVVASGKAELPIEDALLRPIIKSVKVEDGKFKVTVEEAVPYLKYELTDAVRNERAAETTVQSGVTRQITLETPLAADGQPMLIKVTAGRNQ